MEKLLVTGANGQLGSELIDALIAIHGEENVIGLDLRNSSDPMRYFEIQDVTDKAGMQAIVEKHKITTIYHLVGILSAVGEKNPSLAWDVNVNSLKNILDISRDQGIKLFWPSSIAVFGPTSPKLNTPQKTTLEPSSIYGVSKVAGELLCKYYFDKYAVDVRSLRFPGLISHKTPPGGGTTDYAIAIFHEALKTRRYTSFLSKESILPMMYMPDAINAVLKLMAADKKNISIRTSYNLTAISFSVEQIAEEIKKHFKDFKLMCKPDFRQDIADSWPDTIDDSQARADWGWTHSYELKDIVTEMFENLRF